MCTLDSYVFDGMVNRESIALGGQVSLLSSGGLQVEWMLYPDALESCPDRLKWYYNNPERHNHEVKLGDFEVRAFSDPPSMSATHLPTGTELHIKKVDVSREDGTITLTIGGEKGTCFFGLGEQFVSVEHGGRRIVCESCDWWNKRWFDPPAEKHSYIPIPFLLTSAGYGIVVLGDARITFDLRDAKSTVCSDYQICVESAGARLVFIVGESPQDIITKYVALTGKPFIPPRWALEPLLGIATDHRHRTWNRQQQDELIAALREHDIPNGLVLDEAWNWTRKDASSPTGHSFRPDRYGDFWPDNFDDPSAAIDRSRLLAGSRTIFIVGPFVGCDCEYLEMLKSKRWLVRRASNPDLFLMGQYNHYFLDFTHPEAVAWWQQKLSHVVELGVSGLFCDFGEADEQMDALYHSGGTGRNMGQRYNMLYKQAARDVLRAKYGDGNYYLIARSGWTGLQAVSGILQGDQQTTWEGLRQALTGLLSNSYSGQSVIAHNLGGYSGNQFPELYLRWVGLGVFSPLFAIWSDGEPGGMPWKFDDPTVVGHYRSLAKMRMRLIRYLYSALEQYRDESVPVIRPMWLQLPSQKKLISIDDQFFCGPDILVAPILNPEGARSLYLPEGRWRNLWSDDLIEGERSINIKVPLDVVPAFVRDGANPLE